MSHPGLPVSPRERCSSREESAHFAGDFRGVVEQEAVCRAGVDPDVRVEDEAGHQVAEPSERPVAMTRRQMLILLLLLLLGTQFMLSVDFSVFNVALPTIGRSVGISLSHVQWVIIAFSLPSVPIIGTIATAVAAGHIGQLTRHIHIAVAVDGGVALIAALLIGAALTSPRLVPRTARP